MNASLSVNHRMTTMTMIWETTRCIPGQYCLQEKNRNSVPFDYLQLLVNVSQSVGICLFVLPSSAPLGSQWDSSAQELSFLWIALPTSSLPHTKTIRTTWLVWTSLWSRRGFTHQCLFAPGNKPTASIMEELALVKVWLMGLLEQVPMGGSWATRMTGEQWPFQRVSDQRQN